MHAKPQESPRQDALAVTQAGLAPVSRQGPRLTAIASGKGGVGKTWFAITLSHAWTRLGRRVLLFDGDLGLANIDIQLGLPPGPGLGAVLAGRATLAEVARPLPELGFTILAGQSGTGALASLPPGALTALVGGLRGLPYDEVVLDLGAGLDVGARYLAAAADGLLVLVTDEPTSLTDAYAVIKVHEADAGNEAEGRRAAAVRIVVNQAGNAAAGQRTYGALARACTYFLQRTPPLAGIIARDDRVRDAIRRQTALLTRHPASAAAADVERIARTLLEQGE